MGQNDGHIEHVEWLSREQGTFGGYWLGCVEVFHVVIEQVLHFISTITLIAVWVTHIVPVGRSHL